jgi:DNA replication protein DnaC
MSYQRSNFNNLLNKINYIKENRYKEIYQKQRKSNPAEANCPHCLDQKIIVELDQGEYIAYACHCQKDLKREIKQRNLEKKIKTARLRKEFKEKTLDDFKEFKGKKIAKLAAIDYINNFEFYYQKGIGLTFTGKCGSGKSLLSHIIALEIMKQGYNCIRIVAKEFYNEIISSYNSTQNTTDIIEGVKNVDLLVIDNLNGSRFGADELDKLFIILNHRVEEKKPTIINTTETLIDLEDKLTPDHISRIIGKNGAPIEIGGVDVRRLKGKKITDIREKNIKNIAGMNNI